MASMLRQRCFNHATREAALRCMGCSRSYCRECASEHDGKFLCASCLREAAVEAPESRSLGGPVVHAFVLMLSLAGLWCMFMLVGTVMLNVTAPTHDYTIVTAEEDE